MNQPDNTNRLWMGWCLAFIGIAGGCAVWALNERHDRRESVDAIGRELAQASNAVEHRDKELADAKADQERISAGWSELYKKTCDRAAENLDRAWKAEKALKECEAKQPPSPVIAPVQNPPTPKK